MNELPKKRGRPPRVKKEYPEDAEPPAKWRCLPGGLHSLRHAVFEKHGPNLPTDMKVDSILDVFRIFWSDNLECELLEHSRIGGTGTGTRIPSKEDLHRFLIVGLLMCINSRSYYRK